ncbi:MAG TPA: N-methyl-L-tryptophan oxidase [Chloroflexia bacterium]|nr:N-methyl-L-tryptophan oxidase [Chloroflexia bacterium]
MAQNIVIAGGGVMGLYTAYTLLRRGVKHVTVLERYTVGHDRAASADTTRAVRYEYAANETYSRMVARAVPMWRELEALAGTELYVECGVACWGRAGDTHARQSFRTLTSMGIPIRQVGPTELVSMFPQFAVADIFYATYNPQGGMLRANECMAVLEKAVRDLGGQIVEECEVTALEESRGTVVVTDASGQKHSAGKVLVAPGAWGARLLPRLGLAIPLTANRQQVIYVAGLGPEFEPGRFPVFLNLDHDFYGFPLDRDGMLKASIHSPGPVMDPETAPKPDAAFDQAVLRLMRTYIPAAAAHGRLSHSRMCMYEMTPDEDFVIDRLPGYENVVVATGFSGHGFKFAPIVGEMLADLLQDREPEFPLARFAISRFKRFTPRASYM